MEANWSFKEAIARFSAAIRGINESPPEWPPDAGWHFRPGEFAFRGVRGRAVGKVWAMLKLLATASAPVCRDSIRTTVWPEDQQGTTDDVAISQTIKKARAIVRATFGLAAGVNPFPSVDFGARAAWRFDEAVFDAPATVDQSPSRKPSRKSKKVHQT